jgi:hypothetical protein
VDIDYASDRFFLPVSRAKDIIREKDSNRWELVASELKVENQAFMLVN